MTLQNVQYDDHSSLGLQGVASMETPKLRSTRPQ
jgi:hypothetical protein